MSRSRLATWAELPISSPPGRSILITSGRFGEHQSRQRPREERRKIQNENSLQRLHSAKQQRWHIAGFDQPHYRRERRNGNQSAEQHRARCLLDPGVVLAGKHEHVERGGKAAISNAVLLTPRWKRRTATSRTNRINGWRINLTTVVIGTSHGTRCIGRRATVTPA